LRFVVGVALALLANAAASGAQQLPSGGGPLPSLRRGANGQIEAVLPDTPPRPAAGRQSKAPAAAAPNLTSPQVGRDVAAPAVQAPLRPVSPAGPQPVITVTPRTPSVPDKTPRGTIIATYSVKMSDNSPFAGIVRFGPPYYDNNGIFALRDNNIIVNPNGPGIGPNKTTITDHITLEAIPESRAGR
jgi:hypothetical protein